MNKILIINFRRFGDIFLSAHIIAALKEKYKNAEIHYLCYQDCARAVDAIEDITAVYTLDRKKIAFTFNNKLFPGNYSLNSLLDNLKSPLSIEWDLAVNLSNDKLSAYLMKVLNSRQATGYMANDFGAIPMAEEGEICINEFISRKSQIAPAILDCYNQMLSLPTSELRGKLKSFEANYKKAVQFFAQIRANFANQHAQIAPPICGIQLTASTSDKGFSQIQIRELIEALLSKGEIIPILLCSPDERPYAQKINEQFDNHLSIAEFDFKAASSVLSQLDIIVTPDTSIKHLADCSRTLMVEVIQGSSPGLSYATVNENNLILVQNQEPKNAISGHCIHQCIELQLKKISLEQISLDQHSPSIYRRGKSIPIYVKGPLNPELELSRLAIYLYLQKTSVKPFGSPHFLSEISQYKGIISASVFQKYSKAIAEDTTLVLKNILMTLKGIQEFKSNGKQSSFIKSLDTLLNIPPFDHLLEIPFAKFKNQIENFTPMDREIGLSHLEQELFKLKSNLKEISNLFVYLDTQVFGFRNYSTARNEGNVI